VTVYIARSDQYQKHNKRDQRDQKAHAHAASRVKSLVLTPYSVRPKEVIRETNIKWTDFLFTIIGALNLPSHYFLQENQRKE
jgi:hypothetical protein